MSNDVAGNFVVQLFNESTLAWEDQALTVLVNEVSHTLEINFNHFSLWRVLHMDEASDNNAVAVPGEGDAGTGGSTGGSGASGAESSSGCLIRLLVE